MTHADPSPNPSAPHLPEPSDDQWTLARDLFQSGQTGSAVCLALGISPSTFWRRAASDNWLRRDQPRGVQDAEPLDMTAPVDRQGVAKDKAWRRFCRALDQGYAAEAQRWLRLHTMLERREVARQDSEISATRDRLLELSQAASLAKSREELKAIQARLKARRLEKVESTPTDSHASTPLDPEAPGLSRAERRRREKYRARHGLSAAPSGTIARDKPAVGLLTPPP